MPHANIVAGLFFGDEGKGTSVDFLARLYEANLVVRYNGGPQAAHHVVLPDGTFHRFSQFGSAYFVDGVTTYLSKHMLIEPFALLSEARRLQEMKGDNPFNRIIVDRDCLVITPYHWIINRWRESTRYRRHGTCGRGVGEARADALAGFPSLYMRDLANAGILRDKLEEIRKFKFALFQASFTSPDNVYRTEFENTKVSDLVKSYKDFSDRITMGNTGRLHEMLTKSVSIFEGAQGVLLDETYGFAPYNTWTDTTFRNAHEILSGTGVRSTRIGVLRALGTRHGAGPFPTENYRMAYEGDHNSTNDWQGHFRFGYMDMVLLKYALMATGRVDELFLTHCDKINGPVGIATEYGNGMTELPFGMSGDELEKIAKIGKIEYQFTDNITRTLGEMLNVRVAYLSSGPTYLDKVSRPSIQGAKR